MSTAGAHNTATRENLLTVIEEAGFTPAQRDTLYQTFRRIAYTLASRLFVTA